jgi:preprotein translocase subunit SecA
MAFKFVSKIFGSKNDRVLRSMRKTIKQINALEESIQALDDVALRAKTAEFKKRYVEGETLDLLLPEAFAAVREAGVRTLGMRHFDVQMIGGVTLHQGKIAEMRTGEGKTLMSTLPAYLNALSGEGVHIITVNDYLASRDAKWMSPIYEFLGMSVGVVLSQQGSDEKHASYAADITYGTNNEFGFDYLRDNMALRLEDKVQRGQAFAVVDEVDSILIDEARTPLIISGAAADSSVLYKRINTMVQLLTPRPLPDNLRDEKIQAVKVRLSTAKGVEPELMSTSDALTRAEEKDLDLVVIEDSKQPLCELLETGHFVIDEKARSADLTEKGHEKIEGLMIADGLLSQDDSLYQVSNLSLLHHVQSALRSHHLFRKDVDYIVETGQILLIDEHTGRKMPGRRLSEGLHQAIEAKEGVNIQSESQTLASTTFQNYFRLYPKLSGMTGTADTEAYEFHQIYNLEVVVIPTNVDVKRTDLNDLIYLSQPEKYNAVIEDVKECIEKKAPVLVGTASIETSELLSAMLKKANIDHQVLNAKFHEKEAQIIAEAGRPGRITIATNMAGRGTDIVLGGNLEVELSQLKSPSDKAIADLKEDWKQRHATVIEAGGLHIIGTERHESRRIDNQLRGRAGRQGDPGVSRFYLSLEDPLMRMFASDGVKNMMRRLGMEDGEAIEHRMVSNAIEKAQRKVEGRNFDIRKHLLEFDDVANDQRQVIYHQRNELLEAADISDVITNVRKEVVEGVISDYIVPMSLEEQWDVAGLETALQAEFDIELKVQEWLDNDNRLAEDGIRDKVQTAITDAYAEKCTAVGEEMYLVEKQIMLQVLDSLWKEHLANMDHMRQGINLRAYAQKNPKQEYKRESFELFQTLLVNVKYETIRFLMRIQITRREEVEEMERRQLEEQQRQKMNYLHEKASALSKTAETEVAKKPAVLETFVRDGRKVGRNDPCPCGSGKKYKQCHGKLS